MDINEFHQDWLNNIRIEGDQASMSHYDVFFNEAVEQLVDSEELHEDALNNIEHFEGVGHRNARMMMDSYCFDPVDNSCTVLVNYFSDLDEKTSITNSDVDRLYGYMARLVESSIDGYISDPYNKYEISSAAYRFADELKRKFLLGEIVKFRFYIITDCVISNRIKVLKKEPINGCQVDLSIWDLNRFFDVFKSKQGKEELDVDTTSEVGGGIKCIEAVKCDKYDSYLAVISGKFLAETYINYGSRLLEGNVRSFLSIRGKINKGIRYTILNDPDMFFTYNNGIAITATEVDLGRGEDGGVVITRIKDLQIINGGQTTASVANALIQDKAEEMLKKLYIPAKITVLANPEDAEEVVPRISRYANSQNKVDEADFFSNSPYHIKLEEFSRKIPAPAVDGKQYQTYWFYERARGQYGQEQMKMSRSDRQKFQTKNPKNQLLKKVDVAKYLNTYDYLRPDYVSKGAQTNMRYFAETIVKLVEKDNRLSWVNEQYYKNLIAKAIIFKSTEALVSRQRWYQEVKAYRANVVTYSIALIREVIEEKYSKRAINLQRIWGAQKLYPEFERQLEKTTKEVFDFITRDNELTHNVTEWCKKDECWKRAIKEDFDLLPEFVDTLITKRYEEENIGDAIRDEEENNSLDDMLKVTKQTSEYWSRFLKFCQKEQLTRYVENGCIMVAANRDRTGRYPSEKQCGVIMKVYRRLKKDNILPQDLKMVL